MSLLEQSYKKYNIMNKTTVDDPEGGWVTMWVPGGTVEMALDAPTQTQRMIAQAQNVAVIQSALFPLGTPIQLNTYLRRVDDEDAVYRVQTKPVEAPGPSSIKVLQTQVVEAKLPT